MFYPQGNATSVILGCAAPERYFSASERTCELSEAQALAFTCIATIPYPTAQDCLPTHPILRHPSIGRENEECFC